MWDRKREILRARRSSIIFSPASSNSPPGGIIDCHLTPLKVSKEKDEEEFPWRHHQLVEKDETCASLTQHVLLSIRCKELVKQTLVTWTSASRADKSFRIYDFQSLYDLSLRYLASWKDRVHQTLSVCQRTKTNDCLTVLSTCVVRIIFFLAADHLFRSLRLFMISTSVKRVIFDKCNNLLMPTSPVSRHISGHGLEIVNNIIDMFTQTLYT